ncbi:MAG: ABC transporter permease [Candidatus Solibacter sp.]
MKLRLTLGCLAALHLVILLAPWLAPYDYAEQHRDFPHAPPVRVHFRDAAGSLHGRPFVYRQYQELPSGQYVESHDRMYFIQFFSRGRLLHVEAPGGLFLCGTDGLGRDVFSRVLYGGRLSLLTGLVASLLSLSLGLLFGTLAGFYGGWVDRGLMRGGELFMALPWLYFLLGARAFLPLSISPVQAFLLLVAIIGTVGWVRPARLIRGVVLSARESGFVQAARGFGAGGPYLMRRHLLPLTWNVVLTQATVLIPQYILAEVTLSFLGLGVGEPVPSWGNMLADARQYHSLVEHAWMLAPGLASVPLVLGYLTLADTLLDRR